MTGSHSSTADFKHYVDKHRAGLGKQIVGYETVDHPSENQLVALARKYFLKYDRMAGTLTPPDPIVRRPQAAAAVVCAVAVFTTRRAACSSGSV